MGIVTAPRWVHIEGIGWVADCSRCQVQDSPAPSEPTGASAESFAAAIEASYLTSPIDRWTCDHRGEQVGEELSTGCPTRRCLIPVYDCALHGDCAVFGLLERKIAVCPRCKDRTHHPNRLPKNSEGNGAGMV